MESRAESRVQSRADSRVREVLRRVEEVESRAESRWIAGRRVGWIAGWIAGWRRWIAGRSRWIAGWSRAWRRVQSRGVLLEIRTRNRSVAAGDSEVAGRRRRPEDAGRVRILTILVILRSASFERRSVVLHEVCAHCVD